MKKLFTFVAVMLLAVAANATVLWEETFTNNGDTYIDKTKDGYWPYASQWFEGYTGTKGEVAGSRYSFDYTNVTSRTVTIRGKRLNGDENNTIGLYFGANKTEDNMYVQFEGDIVANPEEGMRLVFDICSSDGGDGGDLTPMIVKVNGNAVTVPATTLGAQFTTSTVSIELPNEAVSSLYFAFNNVPIQKFLTHPRIEVGATAVENVTVAPQATKMIENGQVIIIRDGVRYNSVGTVIE